MNGFNKVILAGNLTRDPELRYTPSGTPVAKFGLAVNRKWKDTASGQVKEEVTFIDISAFGKPAETIAQYLKKGRPLLLEGRLRLEQWEDRTTQEKKQKLGVVLESFTFLESGGAKPAAGATSGADASPATAPPETGDGDVPF